MTHYGHVEKVRLPIVGEDPPSADLVTTAARHEGRQAATGGSGGSGVEAPDRACEFRPGRVVLDPVPPAGARQAAA